MADIQDFDDGAIMHIHPGDDIEAAVAVMDEHLATRGVRCPGGKLVNVCGMDPACPVSWCMEVDDDGPT